METERLLRKVEAEIAKVEEQSRRNDQVNTLYEQAHGLIRSKSWRKALEKIEEIQKLDRWFEDKDGITSKAKAELDREEQEAQRQNDLAAMYSESARLLKDGKYQEALDKWQEVKAIDPKYPDRQWVQRTARKRLAEMTQPVQSTFAPNYLPWIGITAVIVVAGVIAGIIFSGRGVQNVSPTTTKSPNKTSTPHSATATSAASVYSDPTMYDDFNSASAENYKSAEYGFRLWSGCEGLGCNDQISPRVIEGYFDYVKIGTIP